MPRRTSSRRPGGRASRAAGRPRDPGPFFALSLCIAKFPAGWRHPVVNVIRAEEMGMCFGVRDALTIAQAIRDPALVTIHGELVHNPEVTRRLAEAGFRQA